MSEKRQVYIAAKMNSQEKQVRELRTCVEKMGFAVPYDWTEYPVVKPFREHPEVSAEAADGMLRAVMACDIIIVLVSKEGKGLFFESGAGVAASAVLSFITGQKKKRIFVIGEGNDSSIFFFHKSVERLPDVQTLLLELGKI